MGKDLNKNLMHHTIGFGLDLVGSRELFATLKKRSGKINPVLWKYHDNIVTVKSEVKETSQDTITRDYMEKNGSLG